MAKIKTFEDKVIDGAIHLIMPIILIVTIYPFYYVFILSFNDGIDSLRGGIYFFPREFSLNNYTTLLSDSRWLQAGWISVTRTVIGTIIGVQFTALVAYALSFNSLAYRKIYFAVIIFSMYFSGGIIPFYILLRHINLLNTFSVYIIPGMFNAFYMLILIAFFKNIPTALYESAKLDGANDLLIFFKIVLPLSLPAISTIALFFGVGHWNSWLDSVFFVQSSSLRPLAYLMMDIINRSALQSMMTNQADAMRAAASVRVTALSLQMTSMIIAVAPILLVYPFLQKYFVQGIMLGSVKE